MLALGASPMTGCKGKREFERGGIDMMKEMIIAKDVRMTFGETEHAFLALDGVSISAAKDEVVAIMGPSGCGKSTLLKILAGILPCTEGQILFEGADVTKGYPKALKRRLGFVFQDINLLYWRSVEKNLLLQLEMFGLNKDAGYLARIDEMLTLVGLEKFKRVYPRELSGGMQQRVGIARSLVHDPDMLILDEPFGALDEITKGILRFKFLKLFKGIHKGILLVTNSIEEALILSDRIYVMSAAPGRFVEELTVDIPMEKRVPGIEREASYKRLYTELSRIVMLGNDENAAKEG